VTVAIYDVTGAQITMLFQGSGNVGPNEISWDGRYDNGALAATGIYFCHVKTPSQTGTAKLVLLK
jgi:flagellar hook assembly protein FlgD